MAAFGRMYSSRREMDEHVFHPAISLLVPLVAVFAAILVAGLSAGSPAQTKRVIPITMDSFAFKPNRFFVNVGDLVVLEL